MKYILKNDIKRNWAQRMKMTDDESRVEKNRSNMNAIQKLNAILMKFGEKPLDIID